MRNAQATCPAPSYDAAPVDPTDNSEDMSTEKKKKAIRDALRSGSTLGGSKPASTLTAYIRRASMQALYPDRKDPRVGVEGESPPRNKPSGNDQDNGTPKSAHEGKGGTGEGGGLPKGGTEVVIDDPPTPSSKESESVTGPGFSGLIVSQLTWGAGDEAWDAALKGSVDGSVDGMDSEAAAGPSFESDAFGDLSSRLSSDIDPAGDARIRQQANKDLDGVERRSTFPEVNGVS